MREQLLFHHTVAPIEDCKPTVHALLRMSQRNISLDEINFILRHGQLLHCAGAIMVFLRSKDIPKEQQRIKTYARLQGTVVVLDREVPLILTVYRNRENGFKHIRSKKEYSSKPRWAYWN